MVIGVPFPKHIWFHVSLLSDDSESSMSHMYLSWFGDDLDLACMAGAGANASGACMLCGAGAYQTGSGQQQW